MASECETFYEAAEKLYVTAATVSKHILSLEAELGVTLFERSACGVRLTPEGKSRLPIIKKLVEAYDSFLSHTEGEQDELCVYSVPPPYRFGLSSMLRDFAAERPDIHVSVSEKRDLRNLIVSGECELGFVGTRHLNSELLQWVSVKTGRLGVLFPKEHPFAAREAVSLIDLANEEFILPDPESSVTCVFTHCCNQCGFSPKVKQTVLRDDSVLFFVANGLGISLCTEEMLDIYNHRDVACVPLREELYTMGALAKAKNRRLSPLARTFWSFIGRRG